MAQATSMHTPIKPLQQTRKVPETSDHTPQQFFLDSQGRVDYKNKTFKLMKQLTELQVINKKSYNQIRQLQSQVQAFKRQFDKIFKSLGVRNLQEAYKKIEDVLRGDRKNMNEIKLSEWSNIVEQYKKIINTQQYKFIKLEQQLKIAEVKIKKHEQGGFQSKQIKQKKIEQKQKQKEKQKQKQKQKQELKTQISKQHEQELNKIKNDLATKDKQIQSLNQELSVLKKQYKQILIERQNIKDMYEELQNKYNEEIEHFEEMEKHVQERLLEVEREMNFYRFEREGHMEKIQLMKQQLKLNETRNFFSFGGVKHENVQTEFQQEYSPFNSQCMEISIKTLLQQNNKLKNNLLMLYTRKPGGQIPKEIELELKILLNMHDANIKFQRQQVSKQAQPVQVQNKLYIVISQTIQEVPESNISYQKEQQKEKEVEIQQVKEQ